MVKTIRFSFQNQGILCSSLVIGILCSSLAIGDLVLKSCQVLSIRKTSPVIDLSKSEIKKLFCNSKVCVQSKLKSDINPTHTRISRLARYIYQSSSCLRILRVAAWGISISKDLSHKGNNASARVHSIIWLTIQYIERHQKILLQFQKGSKSLRYVQTI